MALHADVRTPGAPATNANSDAIAIVGMAARVPGARDLNEFWRDVSAERNAITPVGDAQLLAAGVPPAALADPDYVKAVAVAPGIEEFDAGLFGMTPREAQVCDPQIRMFLETAHAAIENAGLDPQRISDVGVFGAAGVNRYLDLHVRPQGDRMRSVAGLSLGTLNNADSLSALVSFRLGFTGPSMTVQTACSSSLTAVHLAINAIRMGECDLALAGGAEVEFPLGHGYWWTADGPLSRDGACRPFDARATGTVFGSGAAVVVLKRLEQALRDGDPIRAVIRGSAVNNDGAAKMSFAAPSVAGQSSVIIEAITVAGVDPRDISFVETHGTGTILGDPIEVAGLTEAFAELGATGVDGPWCTLGSVKANVGHLGHAAGATSLIKTVLCLEHEVIPAVAGLEQINPKLPLDGSPFQVNREPLDWKSVPHRPRLAGVTSLGVGGTNVHLVLEEAPPPPPSPIDGVPRILVWSARTPEACDAYRATLAQHLVERGERDFAAVAATLQQGRTPHRYRGALVGASGAEAATALAALDSKAVRAVPADGPPPVAFLLPGQGAQHAGMAADLYGHEPAFTAALDEVFALFAARGLPVADLWRHGSDAQLTDTALAQPLLFAVQYALSRLWHAWGITPSWLLGHSIGELTAAAIAGVFDLPDAVTAVVARVRAMAQAPTGAMLAVAAPADEVIALLPPELALAADNGPGQCVVAGSVADVTQFEEYQRDLGLRVRRVATSHAFHSPAMREAVPEFERALRTLDARTPQVPIISAATGRPMRPEEAVDPAFWAGQLVRPVLFGPALEALLAEHAPVLLEVGPGRTLSALAKSHPAARGRVSVLGTLPPRRGEPPADRRATRQALAALWTEGLTVDWSAAAPGDRLRRVPLPGYRYQRERHWLDLPQAPAAVDGPRQAASVPESPAGTPATGSPFTIVAWTDDTPAGGAADPVERVDALALLPDTALVPALNQAGLRVLRLPDRLGGGLHLPPGRLDDLPALLRALADEDRYPRVIVHGWTLAPAGAAGPATVERFGATFDGVAEVVRQAARTAPGPRPGLLVLTRLAADVSGAEPIDPVNAALPALVRSAADEDPGLTASVVDVADGTSEDALAAALTRWRDRPFVAVRGRRQWSMAEQPLPVLPGTAGPVRPGGVYLLTGGTGGLGLASAKALAGTGQRPVLALLSRTGTVPDGDLAELCALGAQVRVFASDASDPRALGVVVDELTAGHGPVAGVLHLAGVRGSGLVQFGDQAATGETFSGKVGGALALAEVFGGRPPLDFFVTFSSRAAIEGLTGGADYAAANAFLDGFVRGPAVPARRRLSIGWPAWRAVGMATVPALPSAAAGSVRWHRTVSVADQPVTDEHRLDGIPVVPGTAHLDVVVTAFRESVPAGESGPIRLTDVVFLKMMDLTEPRRLEVLFEPAGDGRFRFTVASAAVAVTGAEALQIHARGLVERAAAAAGQIDLDGIRARLPQVHLPDAEPAGVNAFTLGPRWQTIREMRTGESDEVLLTLSLPAPYTDEAAHHSLHPSLLDGATTSVRDSVLDDIHMPFMYRSVIVHDNLPAAVFSHIRRRPPTPNMIIADLDVTDPDGRVVVAVRGFTMRRAPQPDAMVTAARAASAGAATVPPAAAVTGLPPQLGAELLMTLLAAVTPEHVAVRRYRDGGFDAPAPVVVPTQPAAREAVPERAVTPERAMTPERAVTPERAMTPDPAMTPEPAVTPGSAVAESGDPVDALVERLRLLWVEALGVPNIDRDADFFELGGNSLTAIELMNVIRERLNVDLSIAALFDHPTLATLGGEIHRRLAAQR